MFFASGHANDDEYINLRDLPRFSKDRARIEQLWSVHEPFADINFLAEAKEQLHPRLWEMILTNTFKDRGYPPQKTSNDGPEFFMGLA